MLLSLVACVYITDAEHAARLAALAGVATGDTGDTGDADTGDAGGVDDTAPVTPDCDDGHGDLVIIRDTRDPVYLPTGQPGEASWALSGSGSVCSASCTATWVEVFLGAPGACFVDGVPQPVGLPVEVIAGDLGVCLDGTPPADAAGVEGVSCTVETSTGDLIFTIVVQ